MRLVLDQQAPGAEVLIQYVGYVWIRRALQRLAGNRLPIQPFHLPLSRSISSILERQRDIILAPSFQGNEPAKVNPRDTKRNAPATEAVAGAFFTPVGTAGFEPATP